MNSGGFNRRGYLMRRTPIKRYTPLSPVSKDPDRRKRLQNTRDRQFGRVRSETGAVVSDYAAWIRARGCAIRNAYPAESRTGDLWWRCYGPIEAAHLVTRGHAPEQDGIKSGIVGLCRHHHLIQGQSNRRFDARFGVSLFGLARGNAQAYRKELAHGRS